MKPLEIADLFCGAGGSSTGLMRALRRADMLGRLVAVNHWPLAIESHQSNHPGVRHVCQSLDAVSPRDLVPSGHLDLLLASPSCVHHSKAAGGTPRDDSTRATAGHVIDWATRLRVDRILVENVPEFALWGPLDDAGRPIKAQYGVTFEAWLNMLRSLGYTVEHRVVVAADYGDPTLRRRLFVQAVRPGFGISWPTPQFGPAGSGRPLPWRTTRGIIDWTDLGEDAHKKSRLVQNTHDRIAAGIERYGGEPFILPRRQFSNALDTRPIDQPLLTITAGSTDIALITPHRGRVFHRMLKVLELKRAMSLGDDYHLYGTKKDQVRQIGNAVPVELMAAHAGAMLCPDGYQHELHLEEAA